MRPIPSLEEIKNRVKEAYLQACFELPHIIKTSFVQARDKEEGLSKAVFDILLENAQIAEKERLPLCQDTGIPVVWVRLSEGLALPKGFTSVINLAIKEATEEGYLRPSVAHPLTRENTRTNGPAVFHFEITPEEEILEVYLMPKGCGSENMSRLKMLRPAEGLEGVKEFVIETVKEAGPNPCPPLIVGIGIGGTFESSAFLAKKALFRNLGEKNPDPLARALEEELLEKINLLGIGPLGFGGKTTALAVHVEWSYTHIASLPVAINLLCHSARVKKIKFL